MTSLAGDARPVPGSIGVELLGQHPRPSWAVVRYGSGWLAWLTLGKPHGTEAAAWAAAGAAERAAALQEDPV